MSRRAFLWHEALDGQRTGVVSKMLEFSIDQRLQSSHVLTYVVPADDPKASLAVEDHLVVYRNQWFYIDEVKDEQVGAQLTKTVTCNALWMKLAGPKRVGSFVLTSVDAAAGLAAILDGTEWTVGKQVSTASGGVTATQTMEVQDTSILDLVWRWAKLFNLEVVFDTAALTVDFVPRVGVESGQSFRRSRNLTSIKRTARAPEATRVYGYGRDDLTITGINPTGAEFVENLAFYTAQGLSESEARTKARKDFILSDPDIIDEQSLYQRCLEILAVKSQPWVKYEASVVDLSELLGSPQRLNVGDRVRVSDEIFNWSFRTRVVRVLHHPLEPWRDQVELSNLDESANESGSSFRSSSAREWNLFKKDSSFTPLRTAGSYVLNRIGVSFVEGEAVFGYDLTFTGIGTGSVSISALDAEADELVHPVIELPYTDGERVRHTATWAAQELSGQKDYRIRAIATVSGGASGINVEEGESRFWILARGATKRSPVLANSQRFDFVLPNGGVQQFTVPDNVTEMTVQVAGSAGGISTGGQTGGPGGIVTMTVLVTAGQVFDVYVGGRNSWPNGGQGDGTTTGSGGAPGGGSSDFRPQGSGLDSAWLVAAGGGGAGFFYGGGQSRPGKGGLYAGDDGLDGIGPGRGASLDAGGAGGDGGAGSGQPGTFGQGGNAGDTTNSFAGPGGGGGGGWYGGGGAGATFTSGAGGEAGDGGGGVGHVGVVGFDLEFTDGGNTGDGYVVFSWDSPEV